MLFPISEVHQRMTSALRAPGQGNKGCQSLPHQAAVFGDVMCPECLCPVALLYRLAARDYPKEPRGNPSQNGLDSAFGNVALGLTSPDRLMTVEQSLWASVLGKISMESIHTHVLSSSSQQSPFHASEEAARLGSERCFSLLSSADDMCSLAHVATSHYLG
ncbi:uncharacterized protein ACIB01_018260 [Guaruba guarouba]